MRLDWEAHFKGDQSAKDAVNLFLDKWPSFKINGMGIEFAGRGIGIGKTFAATTIGRELIKRREDVFFIPFNQMLHAMRYADEEVLGRLDSANVLILDEIQPPPNEQLKGVMSNHFESIIRNRTNYNGVTIMTTNMSEEEMREHYPRVYSLLSAKQMRVEMIGRDARESTTANRNLEYIMNDETHPIV